jgi:hypothetical protein
MQLFDDCGSLIPLPNRESQRRQRRTLPSGCAPQRTCLTPKSHFPFPDSLVAASGDTIFENYWKKQLQFVSRSAYIRILRVERGFRTNPNLLTECAFVAYRILDSDLATLRGNQRERYMFRIQAVFGCAALVSAFAMQAQATLVTFTGGNVVLHDASTQTTNNSVTWGDVDYYEESGFRLDFLPNQTGISSFVGNYYGVGNDVIHSHWETGDYGAVTAIEITKIGGGTFDLNFFTLTSNTDTGGSSASGFEQAYVQGFNSNVSTGGAILLPPENWGFPATQINLGTNFDSVDKVVFTVTNPVDCFGMDDFFINEIPEPTSLVLCALMGGLCLARGRRRS